MIFIDMIFMEFVRYYRMDMCVCVLHNMIEYVWGSDVILQGIESEFPSQLNEKKPSKWKYQKMGVSEMLEENWMLNHHLARQQQWLYLIFKTQNFENWSNLWCLSLIFSAVN